MPRQEKITKQALIDGAFELASIEGYEAVTARKLAAHIGCSTQPIFRHYESMDALLADVYDKALSYYYEYFEQFPAHDSTPFTNLGLAYIRFAQTDKKIFRLLFLSDVRSGRSMYELLNGEGGYLKHEIAMAEKAGCRNPSHLFMKMWIFIHGAACMALTDDYDLGEKETVNLLRDAYRKFS